MNEFEKKIAARLQGFVDALEGDSDISEKFNCHTVVLDLEPTEYDQNKVAAIRNKLGASQAVFAKLLGASVRAVQAWEQGVNSPPAMACRFMDEIAMDVDRWIDRLRQAVKVKGRRRSPRGRKSHATS